MRDNSAMAAQPGPQAGILSHAQRVVMVVLALNVLVAAMELGWGTYTHMLSMVADGFHSLLDAVSSVVAIVGLRFAMKPPDAGHPYGHRKFEALAAMVISGMIFFTSFEIFSHAVGRLMAPESELPVFSLWSYVIKAVVIGINVFVTWYEQREGKRLNSQLLLADAKHTMADVYVSISVLLTIVAIQFGWYWLDMLVAVVVVVVIFYAGYEVIASHWGVLLDEAVLDPAEVLGVVMAEAGVRGCHRIRTRGMPDHVLMDLHVQVSPQMTVRQAHDISHRVEERLKTHYGDRLMEVLVHIEEEGDDDEPIPGHDGIPL
ncbi:MAG: cation diffusion facilitator family transporter [Candidatus Melainabacteria bacterium]